MAISVTFSLDEATLRKLRDISQYGKNSEKIRELIAQEWDRVFQDRDLTHGHLETLRTESITAEAQP